MNFFGHAAVASWHAPDPEHVLGAMLPDFASMVRSRLRRVHDSALARGVHLHHDTDAVFHAAPTFVTLCRDGAVELEERQLGRGSARAVAHVGTEMLLDGWLAGEGHGRQAYLGALGVDDDRVIDAVELHGEGGHERLRWLLGRLRDHGVPDRYDEPPFVAHRLEQALRPRPRLRLSAADRDAVAEWLDGWRERVRDEGPALVEQVRDGLAADGAEV